MITFLNFIIKHISLLLGILLLIVCLGWYRSCQELEHKESYISDYEAVKEGELRELQMTTKELRESKDSINKKLDSVYRELGIKEKNLQSIQYIKKYIHFRDTVFLKDTIFVPGFCLDTLVKPCRWFSYNLHLAWPGEIVFEPMVYSQCFFVASEKKEFVHTPSKLFFVRWFQKKRKYIHIDIKEENPYIQIEDSRFIRIQK